MAGSLGQEGVRRGSPPRILLHLLDDTIPVSYAGSLIRTQSYWASRMMEPAYYWWGGDPPPELRLFGVRPVHLTSWIHHQLHFVPEGMLIHCHGFRSSWAQGIAWLFSRLRPHAPHIRAFLSLPSGVDKGFLKRWSMPFRIPYYRLFDRIIVEDADLFTRLSGWHPDLERRLTLLLIEDTWPHPYRIERERRTIRALLGVREPERLVGWKIGEPTTLPERWSMFREIQRTHPFNLVVFGKHVPIPHDLRAGFASRWSLNQRDLRWMDVVVWETPGYGDMGELLHLLMHGVVLILLDPDPEITREFRNGHEIFELNSGEDRFLNLYLRWFLRDGQFLQRFSEDARARIRARYARWQRARFLERLYRAAAVTEMSAIH